MQDRCDYGIIRKDYSWILEKDRKCIISPDLDGLLSSVLLSELLGWQVVGVYTLSEVYIAKQVLAKKTSLDNLKEVVAKNNFIFVDHDIYHQDIPSIGHHLLQWSQETAIPDHLEKNISLNPNLLRGITKKQFNRKYPYSTFHFLIACFNAWGLLGRFEPDDSLTTLLLHIDSSYENSIKYQDNAWDWLNWLGGSEDVKSPLYPICKRLLKYNPAVIIRQFKQLSDLFFQFGLRRRSQAAFNNPKNKKEWDSIYNLLDWFKDKTGWRANIVYLPAKETVCFKLNRKSTKPNKGNFKRVIKKNPFSYAIISSGKKGLNYNFLK
jgi:hypothetical protein